jgi:hypothetical protein
MQLPSLPNATLTAVNGPGFKADYDRDAAPGAVKFTGAAQAYFSEQILEQVGNQEDVIIRRSVVVDSHLDIDWEINDTVTVERDGGTITGTIQSIRTTGAPGLAGVTRLILENA